MAILACETFTLKYCYASHLGGTLIARLSDGAVYFIPRGKETNSFRIKMGMSKPDEVNAYMYGFDKQMKKDKYVTVHKQGHYIQLHNRPLGEKSCRPKRTASENGSFDF